MTVARNWVCCVVEPAAFGPIAVGDTCSTSRAGARATKLTGSEACAAAPWTVACIVPGPAVVALITTEAWPAALVVAEVGVTTPEVVEKLMTWPA